MNTRFSSHWLALIALGGLSSVAMAAEAPPLTIQSKPGVTVCQSSAVAMGTASSKVELCVLGGSFAHDQYRLSIDHQPVLQGIDDQTTSGISTTYAGAPLTLTCTPQNQAPTSVSQEEIAAYQKMLKISAEEARSMATLVKTVEVGRLCRATLGSTTLLDVQVLFE